MVGAERLRDSIYPNRRKDKSEDKDVLMSHFSFFGY